MAVKHRLIYQKTAKAVFFHLWRVLPPFVKAGFHEFFNRIKLKGKFAPFFETFIIRKKQAFCESLASLAFVRHRLFYQKTAKAVFFHLWRVAEKHCLIHENALGVFFFLRQVFPYSQKAGFLRVARFARLKYVCFITNK